MATVALNDDAPLGPNDLRVEIDDDVLARVQAVAAANGRAWEAVVIEAVTAPTARTTYKADSTLGAAQLLALKDPL